LAAARHWQETVATTFCRAAPGQRAGGTPITGATVESNLSGAGRGKSSATLRCTP